MQQAMQDPETMQKMLAFAEQMQEQLASIPQLKALTESDVNKRLYKAGGAGRQ
jgi:hypothetical protein